MTEFRTLSDVEAAYQSAVENEEEGKFEQGSILTAAIDRSGLPRKEILDTCAKVSGQSARLLRDRERVDRIFVQRGLRAHNIHWSLHVLCTTGCKIEDPETWAQGDRWLQMAVDGLTDDKGNIKPHNYRTLKAAIKAAGGTVGNDDPIFLLDSVNGVVWGTQTYMNSPGTVITLYIQDQIEIPYGNKVVITLVQANAQETNAA